jgi:RNA polymerase sigma factor (sigma-70 family)
VQQAFLSAFTALSSGSEVRHLRGWLYQIVRNAAGRPQAPPCVPLDRITPSASTVEEVVGQRALAMTALSEIARLPARQRQAMIGTALDGRARAEVASSMGLSEGAVRQLVHRARTTLPGAVTALTPWPLARWIAAVGPDRAGAAVARRGEAVAPGRRLRHRYPPRRAHRCFARDRAQRPAGGNGDGIGSAIRGISGDRPHRPRRRDRSGRLERKRSRRGKEWSSAGEHRIRRPRSGRWTEPGHPRRRKRRLRVPGGTSHRHRA